MAFFTVPKDKRQQFMSSAASRLTRMGVQLPDHVVEEGMRWYPTVHDTVRQQAPQAGLTPSQGFGVVAAVSPNMDFDARNIKALEEIGNIDSSGWDMIQRSAQRDPSTGRQRPRIPEVTEMLKEVAPSISGAYDPSLVKARRIMSGEQWRDVLTLRSAPKTHHFAGNLENPYEDTGVTVDGRHHDIVANQMLSWTDVDRGIDSAGLTRGRSRYEDIEDITKLSTRRLSSRDPRFAGAHPHDVQAALWVGGKFIETQGGRYRKGPKREGQAYTTYRGDPLSRDAEFWRPGMS
jgi:hypothetical protein